MKIVAMLAIFSGLRMYRKLVPSVTEDELPEMSTISHRICGCLRKAHGIAYSIVDSTKALSIASHRQCMAKVLNFRTKNFLFRQYQK